MSSFYWDTVWYEVKELIGIVNLQDEDDFKRISSIIESGWNQFTYPPPMALSGLGQHVWKFLKPIVDDTIPANAQELDLPDDFASICSDISFASGSHNPITYTTLERMRSLWSRYKSDVVTGHPEYFSLKHTTDAKKLWFWPAAGSDTDISYQYERVPDFTLSEIVSGRDGILSTKTISVSSVSGVSVGDRAKLVQSGAFTLAEIVSVDTGANTVTVDEIGDLTDGSVEYTIYPEEPNSIGMRYHRETILESCLAIAEQRVEEVAGIHTNIFATRLLPASISRDQSVSTPRIMGREFEGRYPRSEYDYDFYWNGVLIE